MVGVQKRAPFLFKEWRHANSLHHFRSPAPDFYVNTYPVWDSIFSRKYFEQIVTYFGSYFSEKLKWMRVKRRLVFLRNIAFEKFQFTYNVLAWFRSQNEKHIFKLQLKFIFRFVNTMYYNLRRDWKWLGNFETMLLWNRMFSKKKGRFTHIFSHEFFNVYLCAYLLHFQQRNPVHAWNYSTLFKFSKVNNGYNSDKKSSMLVRWILEELRIQH